MPISDAGSISANRIQSAQSDPARPVNSSLVYFSHLYQQQHTLPVTDLHCSVFETRPSLGTHVSLRDTKLTNTAGNIINSPAPATEQSPSGLISAEVEVLGILSAYTYRYCIQNESSFDATSSSHMNLVSIDESPVSSPPASLHISSSQPSFSEPQNSQNQSSFSDTVLNLSHTLDIPEPSSTNNLDLSSSPPNSSPAKIFSSSPFVSSQSSLPASDEPEKVSICNLIICPDYLTDIRLCIAFLLRSIFPPSTINLHQN